MKKYSDSFTQGGQTELHKFHMMRQVFWATLKISSAIAIISFGLFLFNDHIWQDYYFLGAYYKAVARMHMDFLPKDCFHTTWIVVNTDQWVEVTDTFMTSDHHYLKFADHLNAHVVKSFLYSILVLILSIFSICGFWIWRGKKRQETKLIKGFQLVTAKALKKSIKRKNRSDININQIPLPFAAECQHMMITGTTGSGKSNAMHSLLLQIRHLGHKAIILDTTGELVSHFYQSETDHILNALDKRGRLWDLWKECSKKSDYEEMAEFLIPNGSSHDPIWTEGPRTLFSECASIIAKEETPSVHKLLDVLIKMPLNEVSQFLKGTIASSMVDPKIEKAALSIRMILASALKSLGSLEDEGADFSIQQWIQNTNSHGWLFLSCLTNQRALMSPLLSIWLSISVKALMKIQPDRNRRVWFIIDELGTLKKLPVLLTALAEVRKYGGCFVIGFQDIWQLEETYGKNITHSLSGLTGTKMIFRTSCSSTAERMSRMLGEQEVLEASESISYGAHQMRDGVNLSGHRMEKTTISASDIMQLKNLHAYLKLPESSSIAEIEFPFIELPRITSGCIEKNTNSDNFLDDPFVSNLSNNSETNDNEQKIKLEAEQAQVETEML